MNLSTVKLIAIACFIATGINAQDKSPYKFGKVSVDDLQKKVYSIDSSANAVVLADIGTSRFEGNNKGDFSLFYKRYTRIHILNKNAYDLADVKIYLYEGNSLEEELANVKAITYNLVDGKVVETKLEKANLFREKIDKNWFSKKFTLPNIKEGCIIEFQYEIKSDFIRNLQSWTFQGNYPILWSEYTASIPQFYEYAFLAQGYQQFHIRDSKSHTDLFTVKDTYTSNASRTGDFSSGVTDYRWVMKDVPALKEENFTSTINNHISKIEFQLTTLKEPYYQYKNMMGTWVDLAKELKESENFGSSLEKDNNWLGDIEKPLLAGAKDNVEKAARVYAYVRDNFTCTDHNDLLLNQTLRNVMKTKNGSVADINLLLTAMLRYADIKADPVILSTKAHGYTHPLYPLLNRFNYVVAQATIDNKTYYFDASVPRLGFNKLMPYCYNGHARIMDDQVTAIDLNPDSLNERKMTSMFIISDEKGGLSGTLQQSLGYYASMDVRDKIKEKGSEDFQKELQKVYGETTKISNVVIDSLDKPDEIVGLKYKVELNNQGEDIIYFDPMFAEAYKQNPFKSAERFYPVEMPYKSDETYILNLEVPKGYVVDELPKSVRMKMNEEGDGFFEYVIQQQGETISMRTRVTMKRTYFVPEEYEILREFFNQIVKKQGEQIVFKKKK